MLEVDGLHFMVLFLVLLMTLSRIAYHDVFGLLSLSDRLCRDHWVVQFSFWA